MKESVIVSLLGLTLWGYAGDFFYNNGEKIEVTELSIEKVSQEKMSYREESVKYFKTSTGHRIGIKNDILVQCIVDVDCNQTLHGYDVESVKQITEKIFMVTVSDEKNLFKFSQTLYADENISIAHPNFRKKKERR